MVARVLPREDADEGLYFEPPKHKFLNSGCTLLNLVLSGKGERGGWPLGKVVNIVGDKSTGKTLLAEEAMANFLRLYPEGKVYYRESEAAFDADYAKALGLDTGKVNFGPDGEDSIWETVEAIFEDLDEIISGREKAWEIEAGKLRAKNKRLPLVEARKQARTTTGPILYIIDSLDALSDAAEIARDFDKGSYGTGKAKQMSALFRKMVRRCKQAGVCLIIISQIRDRIGANIRGVKYTRSGGRALDFYASIIVYLAEVGKIKRTINKIERTTGIAVKAKCTKNKIHVPFKECVLSIRFGYGIDDLMTAFDYLEEVKKLEAAGFDARPKEMTDGDIKQLHAKVEKIWNEIEGGFKPPKGKYAA